MNENNQTRLPARLHVDTPLGHMFAAPSNDPANPGIQILLTGLDGTVRPVALVEVTSDEADKPGTLLITRTWDNVQNPEYKTRIIHEGLTCK